MNIRISFLSDSKLEITISQEHSVERVFTVNVDKDGITIHGDDAIAVYPEASNAARIDYA